MKPKAVYACCSLFRKARRGKWKLSSGWAAKRWLWLPCRVNAIPSFFCLRVWTSVCMAVLELCGPSPPFSLPGRLACHGPHLQQIFCGPQSQVGLDCVVYSGHRSGLRERLKCLRLCFLLGNHLGLVCPSAGHYPSQGSLQSCFYPWSVASSGLSSWSPSLTPSSVNSLVGVLFERAICFQ